MPFPTAAISAGNLNLLRNTAAAVPAYRGAQYVSLDANTVVFACQIASVSNIDGLGEFAFSSVSSGAAANVAAGMTVWISRTNDIRAAYWVGRARVAPSGTTFGIFYINESSAAFEANDYVFVTDDFRIWPKLGREIAGVFYVDYDITFRQLLPRITGLQRAYANWVTSGFYEIAFSSVQGYAATSGATISSYLWDEADGTFVSGNSASQNPTIKFPPGERYIYLTVTDSGGRTLTRAIKIFAHDPTSYPPSLGFDGASWSCQEPGAGWDASCQAFDGVDDALDGSLVVFWSDETIGGTDGSIGSNVNWVGNLRLESNQGKTDEEFSYDADVNFTLESTAQQLSRAHKALIPMTNVASPSVWGEITNFTPWRGAWYFASEYTTLATVCDFGVDDTSNTFLYPGMTTQGNSPLDVLNDIGFSINSHMEFAPTGEAQFTRDLRFKSTASRNAATTIANWTTTDFTGELNIDVEHVETVGRVDGAAGYYNSTSQETTPLLALWPGVAQNYPDGQSTLTRQILTADVAKATAEAEHEERVGRQGALANPVDKIGVQHPDAYGNAYLVPSFGYYWTWTLDTTTNIRGRSYTTSNRFFLNSVSCSHDNGAGTREVRATYIGDIDEDTLGAPGVTINYPPQGEIDLSIPDIPPFDAFPNIPEEPIWFDETTAAVDDEIPDPNTIGGNPPRDGNTLFYGNATQAFLSQNFIKAAKPKSFDVTPVGITAIQMGLLDQRPGQRRAWLLDYDSGSDTSSVFATDDVYSLAPAWAQGQALPGEYTVLRQMAEGIVIYAPSSDPGTDPWILTYDFSVSDGGFVNGSQPGTYVPGVGWRNVTDSFDIERSIPSSTVTQVTLYFTAVAPIFVGAAAYVNTPAGAASQTYTAGTQNKVFAPNAAGATINVGFDGIDYSNGGQLTLTKVVIEGTNAISAGAFERTSGDDGATWSSPIRVGDSPGSAGGFDAARTGGVTIAGADEQAYKATTFGGAYATLGAGGATAGSQPILLILPYYAWGSTTTKNYPDTTPDYLLGSAALVGSEALWKVTGAGSSTAITDSTGGNKVIPVGANAATTLYGTKIAYIGTAGGSRYLSISANTGTSWSRVVIGSNAVFVRVRRGSTTGQLYLADGTVIKFSRNFTTTLTSKTTPASSNLTWVDILG